MEPQLFLTKLHFWVNFRSKRHTVTYIRPPPTWCWFLSFHFRYFYRATILPYGTKP